MAMPEGDSEEDAWLGDYDPETDAEMDLGCATICIADQDD